MYISLLLNLKLSCAALQSQKVSTSCLLFFHGSVVSCYYWMSDMIYQLVWFRENFSQNKNNNNFKNLISCTMFCFGKCRNYNGYINSFNLLAGITGGHQIYIHLNFLTISWTHVKTNIVLCLLTRDMCNANDNRHWVYVIEKLMLIAYGGSQVMLIGFFIYQCIFQNQLYLLKSRYFFVYC